MNGRVEFTKKFNNVEDVVDNLTVYDESASFAIDDGKIILFDNVDDLETDPEILIQEIYDISQEEDNPIVSGFIECVGVTDLETYYTYKNGAWKQDGYSLSDMDDESLIQILSDRGYVVSKIREKTEVE